MGMTIKQVAEQPDVEHRFVQQIAATQRFRKFRLREQLKLEQRIFSEETVHRWRLRAALDTAHDLVLLSVARIFV